jgi:voltage-gated sodium channel
LSGIATYFYNRWNQFDSILVLATWIPVWTMTMKGSLAQYIGILRVLRILRLLKMLSWISELNIILHSIASSARALIYVIVLMFAFFWHFAVAGVFMFEMNDPQHFGTLFRAFLTLLQVRNDSCLDSSLDISRSLL